MKYTKLNCAWNFFFVINDCSLLVQERSIKLSTSNNTTLSLGLLSSDSSLFPPSRLSVCLRRMCSTFSATASFFRRQRCPASSLRSGAARRSWSRCVATSFSTSPAMIRLASMRYGKHGKRKEHGKRKDQSVSLHCVSRPLVGRQIWRSFKLYNYKLLYATKFLESQRFYKLGPAIDQNTWKNLPTNFRVLFVKIYRISIYFRNLPVNFADQTVKIFRIVPD